MIITINNKDIELKFGVHFLRILDRIYEEKIGHNIGYGVGIEMTVPKLVARDAVTLSDYLYIGTAREKKRPTQEQIDDYIDQAEDIESLFTEVIEELKKSNASRSRTEEAIERYQKELEKQK